MQRQQIQIIGDLLWLGIDDNVDIARGQSSTMPKETKRKSRRQLKSIHQHMPALRKRLHDGLLSCSAVRDVRDVTEHSFLQPLPRPSLLHKARAFERAAHLDENRE